MKATFFTRFTAYLIDIIILSIIMYVVGYALPNNTKQYEEELNNITNQYLESEITNEEYLTEYKEILYASEKSNVFASSISLVLTVAYFVVFQYMNQGQTIGKKLLKIKVVDKDTKKPLSVAKGFIRSIFILNIASELFNIIFINIFKENAYLISYGFVSLIEIIFIIVTIFFVLYRKDGRGLHDMMSNASVINERS